MKDQKWYSSKVMVDREEIRDRLETNLSFCRLPRALAVVQRRRADIIKQWSIDETQSWFYSRSESLDRHLQNNEESEKASVVHSLIGFTHVQSIGVCWGSN